MALGVIKAVKEQGLQVPFDIKVIGCDDIEACMYSDPALSTIRQEKEKIGILAARMLMDIISGLTDSSSILVDPKLIIRSSCGTALNMSKG